MALNYVTLTGTIPDGAGATVTAELSGWETDTIDKLLIPPNPQPVTCSLAGTFQFANPGLLANDNPNIPPGSYWTITISGIPGVVPLTLTVQLLYADGATQDLSTLATMQPATPVLPYLPVPAGTPQAGYVPVSTGSGEASVWASPGAASIPLTTLGDTLYENATPTPTRLAGNTTATRKFLRQQGTGTVSAAPAWDTLVAGDIPALAYDAAGTSAAETTRAEAAEALALQKANNLSDVASAATARSNLGLGTAATQNSSAFDTAGTSAAETTRAEAAEALLAPLASPAFTGNPTAPTQTSGDSSTKIATDAFVANAVANGNAAGFTGNLAGDVTGTQGATSVGKVQGVAITAAEANLVSDLNNATSRTATATLLPGEETIFSGSTASQTLTLPVSPPSSSINSVTNAASVSVTLAPGAGATLSNFGTAGNITIPSGYTFTVVYIGTTWYVVSAGPSDFAKNNALGIANGGTGATTAAAALTALGALPEAGGTMTGWLAPAVSALTFVASGTTLVNAALGNAFNLTLIASTTTLGAPSNPVDGQVIRFRITQGTGGSFTLAYASAYDFGAAGAPTLSTAAGKVDILGFEYVASISKWCYVGSGLGF